MRSIVAVAAGAFVTAIVFTLGAAVALLTRHGIPLGSPGGPPDLGDCIATLAVACVAGVAGGWSAARLVRVRPLVHVAALAMGLAVVAWWGFAKPASRWPRWFAAAAAASGAASVLGGGMLAQRKPAHVAGGQRMPPP